MTRKVQSLILVAVTGVLVFAAAALFGGVERSRHGSGALAPTVATPTTASTPGSAAGVASEGSARAEGPAEVAPDAMSPSMPDGRALFRSLECTRCHSAEQVGRPRGALDDVATRLDPEDIRRWIVAPQSIDPAVRKAPYDDLSDAEVDAIVAYLVSLARTE